MYLEYWQLKERPFDLTPDPKYIFYARHHEQAMLRLLYTVRDVKGAMLLTGACGCGKTTLSRVFINELLKLNYEVALLTNPRLNARELLEEIIYQLGGGRHSSKTKVELINVFNEMIYANQSNDIKTVIIIDEAQSIGDIETFEELRLLLNFQQNDCFLLTLILLGHPELRDRLSELPQLRQRLAIDFHLGALDAADTINYIDHRLRVSGCSQEIFTEQAKKKIAKISNGVPRVINGICDEALLIGFFQKADKITDNFLSIINDVKEQEEVWSG